MDAVVTQIKRQIIKLGYIVVLQTAGRSATYNPQQYGVIYDELARMKQRCYERVERPVCRPVEPDRVRDAAVGANDHGQLPLRWCYNGVEEGAKDGL